MQPVAEEKKLFNFEEYLAFEAKSEVRHEFDNGKLTPIAGGTLYHSIIANMIGAMLLNFLRSKNRDCHVANSDLKVYIPHTNLGVYPDVTVICEEPQFYLGSPAVITNPQLIVEVLSADTEAYDRTTKFENYCSIPSFREYVLVAQDRPFIEAFYLHDPETALWKINRASGLEASITLLSLGCELALKDVYRGGEVLSGATWLPKPTNPKIPSQFNTTLHSSPPSPLARPDEPAGSGRRARACPCRHSRGPSACLFG